ncbi:GIN3 [Nakaseomyces glabratus]|uniref:Meiotic sister chromatid recombination protein 1 n=1 Tax=Candida glabrata (strain ATCC 2001 / BCRC 20586 / JCM 3761 / NBRC 0622 / NRRL Y-65 / CBS 138) TaxID=284593 RepID=Q6FXE5_CANGA|nr:uncharacterized protein CAGL0B02563g [Nakaseomyces glabratus]KAH7609114.1 putative stress-responsive nuclear envelope protein [Nakaseomyces glabratus]KAH7609989.1 putative stress-responsive nuclear envelope protein [Nakaseomyces glabratus]QHS64701.1 GIN3 [Nakaseomyces glabratus]CAG57982.1 unnamed protein product [Nakaseomyces glabratus]|eukprot:XP_445082.1 uncharacterized protein CAGL0B02563g [[Candida] glabrata]
MKLVGVYATTLAVLVSVDALGSSDGAIANIRNKFTKRDLSEYVNDYSDDLARSFSKSKDELIKELEEKWESAKDATGYNNQGWWNTWGSDQYQFPWLGGVDSAKSKAKKKSSELKNWFFDSWSQDSLMKFLAKYDLPHEANQSKDQLIKTIKDNFDTISKKLEVSGYYPSSSYFDDWSNKDLQDWLDHYKIKYDQTTDKRDQLMSLVKKNIYKVSEDVDNKRLDLLNQLDLAKLDLFDKAGEIKGTVFDTWNSDQIENWLKSHGVSVKENAKDQADYLKNLASTHANLLKDDVEWYTQEMQDTATPYLKKSADTALQYSKSSFWNLFSFFKRKTGETVDAVSQYGMDTWDSAKLKAYLDSYRVKYAKDATEQQLRDLAVSTKNKWFKSLPKEYTDDFVSWLKTKKNNIAGQGSDTYDYIVNELTNVQKGAANMKDDVANKFMDSFQGWSTDDLTQYLKKVGVNVKQGMYSQDELVAMARENTQWLFGKIQPEPWYKRAARRVSDTASMVYNGVLH